MQIYVPDVNAVFVPILKNASTALTRVLTECHRDYALVGDSFKCRRAVMWRDPRQRIESTYCFMRDQGIDMPFAKWVYDACDSGLRDPHMKTQYSFCQDPVEIFHWDFDAFRKFFRIKRRHLIHVNESGTYPIEWDLRARDAFETAYAIDIRVWGGIDAQAFGPEAARASSKKDQPHVSRDEISLGSSQIDGPGR